VYQQSGLRQHNSTAHQLVRFIHEVCDVFGSEEAVTGLYLNFSEAFCKVWHEGLMLELFFLSIAGI
jgi:hypothetical protein